MSKRPHGRTVVLALAAAAALAATQGCNYLQYRLDDAKEMFDAGFTWSPKPQFGLYTNCPMIAPIGYGKVDGYFVGVADGKVGAMEHHEESAGLLVWGREEVSWDTFDEADSERLNVQEVGLLGLAEGQQGERPYRAACIHYFHLGWIGVTGNIRWPEIGDFLVGLVGLDPAGDDGKEVGRWFWQRKDAGEASDRGDRSE